MSIRLSELTKTTVSFAGPEEPKHLVIRLTDPTLFQCPFIMMTEVGAAFIDDAEAEALRNYLLKGGFLWADDFWGEYAWEAWAEQIGKALPPAQFPPKDLPKDHPLFRAHLRHRRRAADRVDRILAGQRRRHVGAVPGERRAARARRSSISRAA